MNVMVYQICPVGSPLIGRKNGKMDSHGIIHFMMDSYFVTTSRTVYKVSHEDFTVLVDIL